MSKNVVVDLNFTITATISQITEISLDLYDKIQEREDDDIYCQDPVFDEFSDIIDFSQAFSVDEIQNLRIDIREDEKEK